MPKVVLYENIGFEGSSYDVNDNIGEIPEPLKRGTSSIRIYHNGWVAFCEDKQFIDHGDQLWVAPSGGSGFYELEKLSEIWRPHGTNNFNDLFWSVSFQPSGPDHNFDKIVIIEPKNVSASKWPVAKRLWPGVHGIRLISKSEAASFDRDKPSRAA